MANFPDPSVFDPTCLSPNDSINRTVISDIPWLPPELDGRNGYELLGRTTLAQLALESIPPLAGFKDPLIRLDEMVSEGNSAALRIAREYGDRIAALLQTLNNPSERSRAARPQWNESHWNYWKYISEVRAGGGVVEGSFGKASILAANERLPNGLKVFGTAYSRFTPLVGAATVGTLKNGTRIVLDRGSSSIKFGIARYEKSCLRSLEAVQIYAAPEETSSAEFLKSIRLCVDRCRRRIDDEIDSTIPISIASYVDRKGSPAEYGAGACLYEVGPNVSKTISEAIGHGFKAKLIHDGTAAARLYPGSPNAAFIVFGTALGRGVPPRRTMGFSADFELKLA